jgi:hypothetical protein
VCVFSFCLAWNLPRSGLAWAWCSLHSYFSAPDRSRMVPCGLPSRLSWLSTVRRMKPVRRVLSTWVMDVASRCADSHFSSCWRSQREDECFQAHRRNGALAADELRAPLAGRSDPVFRRRHARAGACDRSGEVGSRQALVCNVRVFIFIYMIGNIPCWAVPSAAGFVHNKQGHLHHLSLVIGIVDARVFLLPHSGFLRLFQAIPRKGSAFRRLARTQHHLAHLDTRCLSCLPLGSSLPPDDVNRASSWVSVGSVPSSTYVLSHVVSSRLKA